MRIVMVICCLAILATVAFAEEQSALQTEKEKISYSLGVSIGKGLVNQGIDIDVDLIARGLKDAVSAGQTLLTDQQMQEILVNLQKQVMARQQQKVAELAADNRKKGEEFLTGNKTKEGVVALPSGLQYRIVSPGTGPKPKATDTVVTN